MLMACMTLFACEAGDSEELDDPRSDEPGFRLAAAEPLERAELALRWAPIHVMDVDQTGSHALGGRSDYITRLDFDGDWNARNNWDRASSMSLPAYAYVSVVETVSHWFLVYTFFHPRDWTDSFFDTEHENDSEGVLLAVERDGSTYGALRAAVTVAHLDFYAYVPADSDWDDGEETIDGTLSLSTYNGQSHPITAQEAKGHGLKAWPAYDIRGDGLVYYPSSSTAEEPSHPDDRFVQYRLLDVFETGGLWDRRFATESFASFGSFAGDSTGGCGGGAIGCSQNAANAPWGWDDHDDGPSYRGEMALDPVHLLDLYFDVPEGLDELYTYHPYCRIALYEHCNYAGDRICVVEGSTDLAQLQSMGLGNDQVSSIRVTEGFEATLFADQHFTGMTATVANDVACLTSLGFNDRMSSIQVSGPSSSRTSGQTSR